MSLETHTVRLLPSTSQEQELFNLMRLRNIIWNSLISLRETVFTETGKGLSDFDLMSALPKLKQENPELKGYNSKAAQVIARQIGGSYRSFFSLRKKGFADAKPPQQVKETKWVSLTYNQSGWKFKENGKATFDKVSTPIPYASKLPIHKTKLKEVRIKYKGGKWLCDIVIQQPDQYEQNNSNKYLALDLGIKRLATGIDNDGNVIILQNKAKRISQHFEKQIAIVSSKIDKKHKGSQRRRRLQRIRRKLYARKNSQVKQTLHIQSKRIANMNYHTVILGDLSVKQLMSTEGVNANKKNVRKSFHQSAIDTFRQFLTYKCAGNTEVIEIDERDTTQLNCLTGKRFPQKVELKDREVKLTDTITIDRDLNSSINILKRWEGFHLAALTPPLSSETLLGVLEKHNLLVEKTHNGSKRTQRH